MRPVRTLNAYGVGILVALLLCHQVSAQVRDTPLELPGRSVVKSAPRPVAPDAVVGPQASTASPLTGAECAGLGGKAVPSRVCTSGIQCARADQNGVIRSHGCIRLAQ